MNPFEGRIGVKCLHLAKALFEFAWLASNTYPALPLKATEFDDHLEL